MSETHGPITLHHGDCLDVLATLPDASVDAVVTDPPYGLEFMGKEWDGADGFRRSLNPADVERNNPFGRASRTSPEYRAGQTFGLWCLAWAEECLRVLKPGGHMLAFGGTRTWHRLVCAVEDAGFEVRDSIAWMYGSGFPKSLDVGKAIDKAAGAERTEVVGTKLGRPGMARDGSNQRNGFDSAFGGDALGVMPTDITAPATPDAARWQGWGTALKPAFEPVVVARKPLSGTVAGNVLAHGTGALNIDGCRVDSGEAWAGSAEPSTSANGYGPDDADGWAGNWTKRSRSHAAGRWPANVVLDESQAAALDEQSGELSSPGNYQRSTVVENHVYGASNDRPVQKGHGDSGGASRFFPVFERGHCQNGGVDCPCGGDNYRCPFWDGEDEAEPGARFMYTAKATSEERVRVDGIAHPTVKPLALMRWLVRLVTPPGGTVLEPFAGSGTTVEACILEGFRCIAIEREADYLPLIVQRINRRRDPVEAVKATGEDGGLFDLLGEGA